MIFPEEDAMTEETKILEDMQDEIRELTRKFVEKEVARAQARGGFARSRRGHSKSTESGGAARQNPPEELRENQRRVIGLFRKKNPDYFSREPVRGTASRKGLRKSSSCLRQARKYSTDASGSSMGIVTRSGSSSLPLRARSLEKQGMA